MTKDICGRSDKRTVTDSYHMVLTPIWSRGQGQGQVLGTAMRVVRRLAWFMSASAEGIAIRRATDYGQLDDLRALILGETPRRRRLIVWVPRGWEDFVGSGLAALVDRGDYIHTWACLDGARVMFAGRMGKRPVGITSLAAWTGGAWDAWREEGVAAYRVHPASGVFLDEAKLMGRDRDEVECAVGNVLNVVGAHNIFGGGRMPLSIGAAARRWWARGVAPTVRVIPQRQEGARRRGDDEPVEVSVPLAQRPKVAAGHEGHCCHGLAREQYYRGHVGGRVTVIDLAAAYLVAITTTPLPAAYYRTLVSPSVAALRDDLDTHTGCALVLLDKTKWPYPVYRHDDTSRAVGSFWSWLCGEELYAAVASGHARECRLAHIWHGMTFQPRERAALCQVRQRLDERGVWFAAPYWRALYSSLVGGWAQVSWTWEDDPRQSQLGRWATWTSAGTHEGVLDRWRVLAGRVQRRVYGGVPSRSVPLAYACITACVRRMMDNLRARLDPRDVLATVCDAIWVTDGGLDSIYGLMHGSRPKGATWRDKDTYDDAWMDGRGGAVVKKGDYLFPLLPGVPRGICLEATGKSRWERAMPWTDGGVATPDAPRKRRVSSWDGGRLMAAYGGPLEPVTPWSLLADTELPEQLLLPYDPRTCRRRQRRDGRDTE